MQKPDEVYLVDEQKELEKIKDALLQLSGSFGRLGVYSEEYSINLQSYQYEYLQRIIENNRVCSVYKFYKVDDRGFRVCNVLIRKG